MSALSEITQRAFRESQILDIDRQPSDAQLAESVTILRGIIFRHMRPAVQTIWLGNTTAIKEQSGHVIRDFTNFAPNRAVPQDCYVNLVLDEATTLYLPPDPGDGARLTFIDVAGTLATTPLVIQGNGNLVDGASFQTLATNNLNTSFMFRRDLAEWRPVATIGLVATTQMPFPEEFDDMFVIELAIRLNPRYGKEISGVTAEMYQAIRSRFISRYMSETSSAAPDNLWEPSYSFNGDTARAY